jgi:DNA-binding MarR family transcriptional regulator
MTEDWMVELTTTLSNIVEVSTIPRYNFSMATPAPTTPAVKWLTAAEQDAWRSFITGSRRLNEHLDQDLKALGINHDDYGVLVALSESEGDRMRMSELAQHSVESRSRLSHHIGRLEARGLVTREACPEDRRGSWAVLSAEGRATIEAIAPHHVAGVRRYFLDQLTADELATIGAAFARINASFGPGGGCLGEQCPGTGGPEAR